MHVVSEDHSINKDRLARVRYVGFTSAVGVLLLLNVTGLFSNIAGIDTAIILTLVAGYGTFSRAIGELLETGQPLMFCRRDPDAARQDLNRMLRDLKARCAGPPKGALYVSCLARGPNMFGPDSAELKAVQREIGDVPLVGFFGNGEISHDRLYTYTGVLTLFL